MLHPYLPLPALFAKCRFLQEECWKDYYFMGSWKSQKSEYTPHPPNPKEIWAFCVVVGWERQGHGQGEMLRTPLNVMKKQGGLRCTPTRCLPESLKQPIHPRFLPPTPQFSYPSPYFFLLLPAQFTEQYLCYLKKNPPPSWSLLLKFRYEKECKTWRG